MRKRLRMLDLFAGIGGFSLAGHWMGWETVGFVEWDKFNQKVLAKNFPGVPIHSDIRDYKGTRNAADIICGGFPCQPFSTAGKRQGTNDERYLWPEMLRVIREVQPAYVVGENVAGIYSMDDGRVFEQVCLDLENEGYAVQPLCIPACATGAPHRRDRWWFIAAANSCGSNAGGNAGEIPSKGGEERVQKREPMEFVSEPNKARILTNPASRNGQRSPRVQGQNGLLEKNRKRETKVPSAGGSGFAEPWPKVATRLCRVDDGLPTWVDSDRTNRLKALGNAIVPQVAYQIFKAIQQ